MVSVANGERISQSVVEWNIASYQVRHRSGALIWDPLVVFALIPCPVGAWPIMWEVLEKLKSKIRRAWMERQYVVIAIGLVPDSISIGQIDRSRIGKSTHTSQCAKVMIKRTVFLHHNHDVFDVSDRAGPVVCRNRQRPADASRESCRNCSSSQKLEESTAVNTHG